MEIREYKKVDEKIEKVIKHHEETIDENGNVIPAYDEVIDKVIPIMGWVSSEMTQEAIDSMRKELHDEPTIEERVEAIESAMLEMILGGF